MIDPSGGLASRKDMPGTGPLESLGYWSTKLKIVPKKEIRNAAVSQNQATTLNKVPLRRMPCGLIERLELRCSRASHHSELP